MSLPPPLLMNLRAGAKRGAADAVRGGAQPSIWRYRPGELPLEYRERIMVPLAWIAAVVFIPLALHHLYLGNYLLGFCHIVVQGLLALNLVAIKQHRPPPIAHEFLAVPAMVGVFAAFTYQGIYGALWAFPVVLYGHFVLRRRFALTLSLALWAVMSAMTYWLISPGLAVRFCISLLLTIVIVNVVLDILLDIHRRLAEQAVTDPLTGALNRRHLDTSLKLATARGDRSGTPQSMLVIDADRFKDINDMLGHLQGDEVLKQLVALIQARARSTDQLFRLGGEEFMLLIEDARLGDALALAESLRTGVQGAVWPQNHPVTVSIGVAEYVNGESWETWLQRADLALYRAKHGGRNLVIG